MLFGDAVLQCIRSGRRSAARQFQDEQWGKPKVRRENKKRAAASVPPKPLLSHAPKSLLICGAISRTPNTTLCVYGASAFGSSRRSSQVAALQVDVLYEKPPL